MHDSRGALHLYAILQCDVAQLEVGGWFIVYIAHFHEHVHDGTDRLQVHVNDERVLDAYFLLLLLHVREIEIIFFHHELRLVQLVVDLLVLLTNQ